MHRQDVTAQPEWKTVATKISPLRVTAQEYKPQRHRAGMIDHRQGRLTLPRPRPRNPDSEQVRGDGRTAARGNNAQQQLRRRRGRRGRGPLRQAAREARRACRESKKVSLQQGIYSVQQHAWTTVNDVKQLKTMLMAQQEILQEMQQTVQALVARGGHEVGTKQRSVTVNTHTSTQTVKEAFTEETLMKILKATNYPNVAKPIGMPREWSHAIWTSINTERPVHALRALTQQQIHALGMDNAKGRHYGDRDHLVKPMFRYMLSAQTGVVYAAIQAAVAKH